MVAFPIVILLAVTRDTSTLVQKVYTLIASLGLSAVQWFGLLPLVS
jgi:hypothetical protein